MKIILITLFVILLTSCYSPLTTINRTEMLKKSEWVVKVKRFDAWRMKKQFKKKNINVPEHINGEMKLYFEHLDSTIRFRPYVIKQLKK